MRRETYSQEKQGSSWQQLEAASNEAGLLHRWKLAQLVLAAKRAHELI